MKLIKIDDNVSILCESKSTRNGFKHTAYLLFNGSSVLETKICYINRTWESYEYESVINKLKEIATTNGIFDFKSLAVEKKI